MNWSWGKSIVVAFIIFIGLVSWALIKSFNTTIELVTPNYYEEELKFEKRISETKAGNTYQGKILFQALEEGLHIQFPKEWQNDSIEGEILMYRPNDSKKDFITPIQFNESQNQILPANQLLNGKWRIKISWKENETRFYYEEILFL